MRPRRRQRPIRLLFFADASRSSINAQDLNAREIAARLDPVAYRIIIFHSGSAEVDARLARPHIRIVPCPGRLGRVLRRFWWTYVARVDFHFYLRTYQHPRYWFLKKLFLNNARTIHIVENMLPYPAGRSYNERARLNAVRSDFIFGISSLIRQQVKELYGRHDVRAVRVGIDPDVFAPAAPRPHHDKVRVLGAGSLQQRKRVSFFLDAARVYPQAEFRWIGSGALRDEILAKQQADCIDNFILLSSMEQPSLAREMSDSDIFFFPSLHEGFPKVVLEAMASGLPVIVFSAYGPEAVEHGRTGLVASDDEQAIRYLGDLITDSDLRATLGRNGAVRARLFDWNVIAREWDLLLKEMCRREGTEPTRCE